MAHDPDPDKLSEAKPETEPEPGSASEFGPGPGPATLRARVLVATADPGQQQRIAVCLGAARLACVRAADGERAVELALSGSIDLVLVDAALPLMDGLAVARLLRAAGAGMPIVALSADVAPADVARYVAAGCSHWLASPPDGAALAALLARLLPAGPPRSLAQLDGFAAVRRTFDAGLAARLARIDGLLGSADLPGAAALAHMLKGSAGSFGYPRVSELAGALEHALLDGDAAVATLLLAHVRRLDELQPLLAPAAAAD